MLLASCVQLLNRATKLLLTLQFLKKKENIEKMLAE